MTALLPPAFLSSHRVSTPCLATDRYTARLALDDRTREKVHRLRYSAYLAGGHIEPNANGLFRDRYDDLPNSHNILVELDGAPAASVRTCSLAHGSSQQSTVMEIYAKEVNELLTNQGRSGFGQRGIEVNRLVRGVEYENNQGLVFLLYRLAGYVAMATHAQVIFACVRSHHRPLYKRLGYQSAAAPRTYPGLKCEMELLYCPRDTYDRIRAAYPVIDPYTTATGPLDDFLAGATVPLTIV